MPSPRSARSEKAERPAVPEINVKSSPLEETKITETTVSSEKSKPPKIEEPEVVKLVEFHEEVRLEPPVNHILGVNPLHG